MDDQAEKNIIYCIGDSHVNFFSGWNKLGPIYPIGIIEGRLPFFKTYCVGPALAYNLNRAGSKTHGREKLFEILKKIPRNSKVLLAFGEIDCRVHLLKQSQDQNRPLEEIIQECAHNYFSVINELDSLGFEVKIWNVIPSSLADYSDPEYPTHGSCLERNKVSKIFNNILADLCRKRNITFIDIFDKLTDNNGLTDYKYYLDIIHLSQKAMPIALEEFKEKITDIDFSVPPSSSLALAWSNLQLLPKNMKKKLVDAKKLKFLKNWINFFYFLRHLNWHLIKLAKSLLYNANFYKISRSQFKGIQLGSGDNLIKGFLNIDGYWLSRCDIQSKALDNIKLASGSVETIYCSHLFEHLPRTKTLAVLTEWRRVLKDGGKIFISVPDLEILFQTYLDNVKNYNDEDSKKLADKSLGIIYGGQSNKFDYHYYGYSFPALKNLLEKAGFIDVKRYEYTELNFIDFVDAGNSAELGGQKISLNIEGTK